MLALGIGVPHRLDAEAAAAAEVWHEYFFQGKKVGWSHCVWERKDLDGSPALWIRTENERRIKTRGVSTTTRSDGERFTTTDFVPLSSSNHCQEVNQVSEDHVLVKDGKVTIRKTVNGKEEVKEIDLAGRVVHDMTGDYLASLHFAPGDTAKDHAIETRELAIGDVTIEAQAREKVKVAGKDHDTLRFLVTDSLTPNLPTRLWVDDDGTVVQMEAGPMSMRLATEEQAKSVGAVAELANTMLVTPVILFPERFQEVTLAIKLAGGDTKDILPEGPYHRVTASETEIAVTMLAQPAPMGATVERPVTEASVAEFLRATPRCGSDDPAIVAKAKEIVGDEQDALAAAAKVVHWVFRSLKKESSVVGAKTARETLDDGSGDCTEHAVLVAALCRAAGVPARCAIGLLYTGKEVGYHQWAEVWVGRWVPCDATIDAVGTAPAYLCFGLAEEGPASAEATSRMMRFFGRAKVSVTRVKGAGGERTFAEKEDLLKVAADRVEHFGWGVTYPRIKGWKHQLMTETDAAVFRKEGYVMQIRPLPGAPPLTQESAQELRATLTNVLENVKTVDESMIVNRPGKTYLCGISGTVQGEQMRYWMALVQRDGRTFLLLFTGRDTPDFADESKTFDAFLGGLQFP